MKRSITFLLFLAVIITVKAQENLADTAIIDETPEKDRIYAELSGYVTHLPGENKNVTVSLDLGQYQVSFKTYTLMDEEGKAIRFNSMVAAMNYMSECGWRFAQAYMAMDDENKNVYHWIIYKDIIEPEEIYDGLKLSYTRFGFENFEPEKSKAEKPKPEKKKKTDKPKKERSSNFDPLYGY